MMEDGFLARPVPSLSPGIGSTPSILVPSKLPGMGNPSVDFFFGGFACWAKLSTSPFKPKAAPADLLRGEGNGLN